MPILKQYNQDKSNLYKKYLCCESNDELSPGFFSPFRSKRDLARQFSAPIVMPVVSITAAGTCLILAYCNLWKYAGDAIMMNTQQLDSDMSKVDAYGRSSLYFAISAIADFFTSFVKCLTRTMATIASFIGSALKAIPHCFDESKTSSELAPGDVPPEHKAPGAFPGYGIPGVYPRPV